jgi:hypothetical protein
MKSARRLSVSGLTFAAVLLLTGCAKEPSYDAIDFHYDYFPNLTGGFVEYQVQEITHDAGTSDTLNYFMREFVAESFIDGNGHTATRIERSIRFALTDDYELVQVLEQKRTPTNAQRVEDNQRYVVMVFPLAEGETWDGNAYNVMDRWDYVAGPVAQPYQVGFYDFDETVRIDQRNSVNLVEQQVAWEVYARNVGLIQKHYKNLTFQNFEITGSELYLSVIGFGSN